MEYIRLIFLCCVLKYCYTDVLVRVNDTIPQGSQTGIVEVYKDSSWQMLCAFAFTNTDAKVVCEELGYTDGKALLPAAYGRQEGRYTDPPFAGCKGDERTVLNCSFSDVSQINICRTSDTNYAAVSCYNTTIVKPDIPVRLSDEYFGSVEYHNGFLWGQVCLSYWGDEDATVVCRQLNFTKGVAMRYPATPGLPFTLTGVNCNGNENHLDACSDNSKLLCDQADRRAGVLCYNKELSVNIKGGTQDHNGRVEINYDGEVGTICRRGFALEEAVIICRQNNYATGVSWVKEFAGTGSVYLSDIDCDGTEESIFMCKSGGWRNVNDSYCMDHKNDAVVFCFEEVRLFGGTLNSKIDMGGVEVFHKNYSNRWTTLCYHGFDQTDAEVLCRQLGYSSAQVTLPNMFGRILYWTFTYDLRCSGKEERLLECQYKIGYDCPQSQYAGVACINGTKGKDVKFSLDKGFSGKVLVEMYGVNGTVCRRGWDDNDATVLCRSLGYHSGIVFGTPVLYNHLSPIWMTDVDCVGNETDIKHCKFNFDLPSSCGSDLTSAGALCFTTSNVQLDLRIVGKDPNRGRVEIGYDGDYGTVCDNKWSANDAKVACRQKGYATGRPYLQSSLGAGTGHVYMDAVSCDGSEDNLYACPNRGFNVSSFLCRSHKNDAGVECSPWVRLDPTKHYGAVEFWSDKKSAYGRVCDDGRFNSYAANVTCQELGMKHGGLLIRFSVFGPMPEHLHFSVANVTCVGTETSLKDCQYSRDVACPNQQYVSVVCTDIPVYPSPTATVRLQSVKSGFVEVEHYYQAGLICSEGFDNREANVICKMKNYKSGIAYKHYTQSTKDAVATFSKKLRWLTNVDCDGTEVTLGYCNGLDWGSVQDCDYRVSAGVFCFLDTGQNKVSVTLAGGQTGSTSGRIDISIGTSYKGSVCGDYFTENEASVFCRQSGYRDGAVLQPASFGNGDGILLEVVKCLGNETNFLECLITPDDDYFTCSKGAAAVKCYSTVRLTGTNSPDYGRLEIHNGYRWEAVCDTGFDKNAAMVVCKFLGYTTGWEQCCSAVGPLPADTQIQINSMKCSGSEARPQNCLYKTDGQCPSGKYVSILCSSSASSEDFAVRLPLQSHYGPVEVRRYGMWGYICDAGWDDADANVLCRTLGYKSGKAVYSYIADKDPIIMGSVDCSGGESSIRDCNLPKFQDGHTCTVRDTVAGVICVDNQDQLQLTVKGAGKQAYFYIQAGTKPMVLDSTKFDDNSAGVFCRDVSVEPFHIARNYVDGKAYVSGILYDVSVLDLRCSGKETSYLHCKGWWDPRRITKKFLAAADCHFSVKLVSRESHYGIIEAYQTQYKSWGTVCAENFDSKDAVVVCKNLGYDSGQNVCCAPFGPIPSAFAFFDVECNGTEADFNKCSSKSVVPNTISTVCDPPWNYASAVCYHGAKPTDYTIRLDHGSNVGDVTLRYLNVWGRICSDDWDDRDAIVVCRQLNYNSGIAYTHLVETGTRTHGPYWTSQVHCTGKESRLDGCSHIGFGNVTECKSRHYAGVVCYNNEGVFYRIAGGDPFSQYGRVEVYIASEWATVCDTYWDQTEAQVICRQFGYSTGDPYYGSYTFPPPSLIYETKYKCSGKEDHLNNCPHGGWIRASSARCVQHKNDAGVFCYKTVKLHKGIGREYNDGAVLLYRNGSWNHVCDDEFDDRAATAVCKDIGFTYGKSVCCSKYGKVFNYNIQNITIKCADSYRDVRDCLVEKTCKSLQYASVECSFNPFSTSTTATTMLSTTVAVTADTQKASQSDNTATIIAIVLAVVVVITVAIIVVMVVKIRRSRGLKQLENYHDSVLQRSHDGSFHIENPLHGVQEQQQDDNQLVNIRSPDEVTFRVDSDADLPMSYNNPNYETLPTTSQGHKSIIQVNRNEMENPQHNNYNELESPKPPHVYDNLSYREEDNLHNTLAQSAEIHSPTNSVFTPNFPKSSEDIDSPSTADT